MDCTNEDHRPVICFRVGRMHWQPAERRNEANCRRSMRTAHGRNVRCYRDGGHGDLTLQLPFMQVSESMGNHDSKIVDAASVD